ncbi:chorismate mutase [Brevundimonas sp.]|uniref:chorismate mutase n=1 Tax=Brevundimonas sp. TaxID=1871086 RepID=UPI0025C6CFE0|nr:chorismate mutase [Brevundimonas sp.]
MSHALHPVLQPIWPPADRRPEDISPERMALAALRHEIDQLDDEILALFERRLAIAARVGRAKDAPAGPHLKLRPDREQAVLDRLSARARPDNREAVQALWREIVGHGLARQGRTQVQVWAPVEPVRAFDAARRRFGAGAGIRLAEGAEAALKWAAEGQGAAVLAVNDGDPWWISLRRQWTSLSVFEGLGGAVPTALAVGRIDPAALPSGPRVVIGAGGDAGDGDGRRVGLATHHGWTLSLTDAPLAVGGPEGCVGAIGG